MNIEEIVVRIIAQENHLDPSSVTLDSTFAELGIDSLDGLNILFALEAELNVPIPDAVARHMSTVRQVVESLTRVVNGEDVSDLVALLHQAGHAAEAVPAA